MADKLETKKVEIEIPVFQSKAHVYYGLWLAEKKRKEECKSELKSREAYESELNLLMKGVYNKLFEFSILAINYYQRKMDEEWGLNE